MEVEGQSPRAHESLFLRWGLVGAGNMARGFPLAKMQAQKQAGVDASAELGTRAFVGSDCKGFQRRSIRPGAWKSRRSRGEVQTAALQYSVVVEMSGHSFDHRLVSSRHEGRRRANDSPEGGKPRVLPLAQRSH